MKRLRTKPAKSGWLLKNSGYYCSAWAAQGQRNTQQKPFLLDSYNSKGRYQPSQLWSSMQKAAQFQLGAVLSLCKAATGEIQTLFILRATCHTFLWGNHYRISSDPSWLGPTQNGHGQWPFFEGQFSLVDSFLSPPDKARGAQASPLLALCGSMRECAGSKASSLQNHWATSVWCWAKPAQFLCTDFFFFPHFLGLNFFLPIFLNGRYPTYPQ